jgi:hypothetical protein
MREADTARAELTALIEIRDRLQAEYNANGWTTGGYMSWCNMKPEIDYLMWWLNPIEVRR